MARQTLRTQWFGELRCSKRYVYIGLEHSSAPRVASGCDWRIEGRVEQGRVEWSGANSRKLQKSKTNLKFKHQKQN